MGCLAGSGTGTAPRSAIWAPAASAVRRFVRYRARCTARRAATPRVVRTADGLRVPARLHETTLVREHDELRAVARTELDHRPAHVGLRGRGAHDEPFRDLVVREARGRE